MDGFAGYKTAAAEVVPDAVTVMDPFHVVALAGAKLDLIRQRIQQQTLGQRRGSALRDSPHRAHPSAAALSPLVRPIDRRTRRRRAPRRQGRLRHLPEDDRAYADANRRRAKQGMSTLIDSIRRSVPAGLEEIAQLGHTLSRRRADILAFFDHHTSNGPTEAINGRLEALRRNALGFRNLTHYRTRSLLHSGAFHKLINAL